MLLLAAKLTQGLVRYFCSVLMCRPNRGNGDCRAIRGNKTMPSVAVSLQNGLTRMKKYEREMWCSAY